MEYMKKPADSIGSLLHTDVGAPYTPSQVNKKDLHYVSIECSVHTAPKFSGSMLVPKLRFDLEDLEIENEDKVVTDAVRLIRETFSAARRINYIQTKR